MVRADFEKLEILFFNYNYSNNSFEGNEDGSVLFEPLAASFETNIIKIFSADFHKIKIYSFRFTSDISKS